MAGASFIFGANGLGFLLMFLAILQWKRVRIQSNLPLENFFESLTTAIRYVRYTPGIKILLARHSIVLVLYRNYPVVNAGRRPEGITS